MDLQRAFRHLKLDPRDINKTRLQFCYQQYIHGHCCPIGVGYDTNFFVILDNPEHAAVLFNTITIIRQIGMEIIV